MERFFTRPEWLEIVREQERKLIYPSFDRESALLLGLKIVEFTARDYHKGVAVAILEDDMTVFSYKMPGSGLENEWWMRRKLNAARATGGSSLLACLRTVYEGLSPDWIEGRQDTRAACGGCFPLRLTDGGLYGYVLASGLEHYEDHQVVADALAADLGVAVPRVEK